MFYLQKEDERAELKKLKTEDWKRYRKEPRACSYNTNGEGCLSGSACSKWFSLWKQVREYDLFRLNKSEKQIEETQ